ncbi:MAG: mitochondrial fission ELM1 family protein [Alphaproteobacteria bacterium]|nr:mitochondrial fission ELM1 family protein [Alphaproteobacteria bacterium]
MKKQKSTLRTLSCWIMNDGKIGTLNQCLGLAEAVARQLTDHAIGLDTTIKLINPRLPWRRLPAKCWFLPLLAQSKAKNQAENYMADAEQSDHKLTPPWPDLIISCGRTTAAPTAEIRRRARGATVAVAVQDPRLASRHFDLVVVGSHDTVRGPKILVSDGALHRVTDEKLAEARQEFAPLLAELPRPLVAVSLGGNNPHYRFGTSAAADLAERLIKLAQNGCGLAITPSRRTAPEALSVLHSRLAQSLSPETYYLWDGTGKNPYFGLLAYADHLVVTGDSVSMISEAAATGKPVHVYSLPHHHRAQWLKPILSMLKPKFMSGGKFVQFHQRFHELGISRDFTSDQGHLPHWEYQPLAESDRMASYVLRILAERHKIG